MSNARRRSASWDYGVVGLRLTRMKCLDVDVVDSAIGLTLVRRVPRFRGHNQENRGVVVRGRDGACTVEVGKNAGHAGHTHTHTHTHTYTMRDMPDRETGTPRGRESLIQEGNRAPVSKAFHSRTHARWRAALLLYYCHYCTVIILHLRTRLGINRR